MENNEFFIEWVNGKVNHIFTAEKEPLAITNIKKGLAGLLQVRPILKSSLLFHFVF